MFKPISKVKYAPKDTLMKNFRRCRVLNLEANFLAVKYAPNPIQKETFHPRLFKFRSQFFCDN